MDPVPGAMPDTGRPDRQGPLPGQEDGISPEMQASAVKHGCRFHRAWYARDASAFYALANWDTREGASAFFNEWESEDEPGEVAIVLDGDAGLVPTP